MRQAGVLLSAAPHGGTLSYTGGHGLFGRKRERGDGMGQGHTLTTHRNLPTHTTEQRLFLSAAARIVAVSSTVPYGAALSCGHTHGSYCLYVSLYSYPGVAAVIDPFLSLVLDERHDRDTAVTHSTVSNRVITQSCQRSAHERQDKRLSRAAAWWVSASAPVVSF